jgi:hypothetical protein
MGKLASARPSKAFFVAMLTRDIELRDAVLDLIDNCIDGIQRALKLQAPTDKKKPYAGFNASLTISPREFAISDNCGGIPRQTAEKYAFRLGRPSDFKEEHLPTVGLYGIGMKRAIFKLGRSCSVTTRHDGDGAYAVAISPKWMDSDDDWDLPITEVQKQHLPAQLVRAYGTVISVSKLHPAIAQEFDKQRSNFLEVLENTIATHYSYIMHKGFVLKVNGASVAPKMLGVLVSGKSVPKEQRIEPFIYETEIDGVHVDLTVGFYREIPTDEEVQEEVDGMSTSGSRDMCGWTVICNDRVVLYSDKTRLTGWGLATVPAYHPQFIAIAGIVRFRSNDAAKLPVTTTKRGIEASSELYLAVREVMQEGLKHFTNFTNHWKLHGEMRKKMLRQADPVDPLMAAAAVSVKKSDWTVVRKGLGGRKFVPALPRPPKAPETTKTIRFTKPIKEFDRVAEYLFDDKDTDPAAVGEECFNRVLQRTRA